MSSVVAEANPHLSTQTARPKTGQGNSLSGNDGFSGLVDENLAATTDSDAASADQPRQGGRDSSADPQPGRRTGVHARSPNQTEPTRQSSAEPSPNDTRPADPSSSETSLTTPVTETVKTGPVNADAATEPVETLMRRRVPERRWWPADW